MRTQKRLVVIKYGGNAMLDDQLSLNILKTVSALFNDGYKIVIVHGGGPFIKANLELAGIKSEFVDGHRKTDSKSMKYVEMALKGEVNGKLVREINRLGIKAVGLSGKDGKLATAARRFHINENNESVDIGQVGDIKNISPGIITLLLNNNFLPVIAPVASGDDGMDYNVNADMFAGHLAGALNASQFIMLTDVDGLMEDIKNPDSLMREINIESIDELKGNIIRGGMIPKTEACRIALNTGAETAAIINGTKPEILQEAVSGNKITGTNFLK